ncbi:hypothetical protein [Acinetobacter modestus]|uniref:hypothetical protein n=1 Tax=Acinetobacter modestus TaxID=1776740 RepID=UPI00301862B1
MVRNNYIQLTESDHYKIVHLYEAVFIAPIDSNNINEYTEIGDFYGEPEVAIIDQNEKWCAIGGCGLIIYFIQEPFTPYQYDQECSQYFEIHRSPTLYMVDRRSSTNFSVSNINHIREFSNSYFRYFYKRN